MYARTCNRQVSVRVKQWELARRLGDWTVSVSSVRRLRFLTGVFFVGGDEGEVSSSFFCKSYIVSFSSFSDFGWVAGFFLCFSQDYGLGCLSWVCISRFEMESSVTCSEVVGMPRFCCHGRLCRVCCFLDFSFFPRCADSVFKCFDLLLRFCLPSCFQRCVTVGGFCLWISS